MSMGSPTCCSAGEWPPIARLREVLAERCAASGISLTVPPIPLCTDNGAMVAALGAQLVAAGAPPSSLEIPADSSQPVSLISL